MARTQAADYDERRMAVLDKAAELYAHSGFHGCSIADLAAACGMSKSLLYHYFASKEDILFEIMDGHIGALAEVAEAYRGEADPIARFGKLTHGFLELYADASARHRVLVNDLDKLPEERRRHIVDTERMLVDLVARTFGEIAPALSEKDARVRAMLYFGMINWSHTWFRPAGRFTVDALAETVIDQMLNGLR